MGQVLFIATQKIEWDQRPCLGVVLAEQGYPEKYKKGNEKRKK